MSKKNTVSIRGAVRNNRDYKQTIETAVYLDYESDSTLLYRETIAVQPHTAKGVIFSWPANGHDGEHQIVFIKKTEGKKRNFIHVPSMD